MELLQDLGGELRLELHAVVVGLGRRHPPGTGRGQRRINGPFSIEAAKAVVGPLSPSSSAKQQTQGFQFENSFYFSQKATCMLSLSARLILKFERYCEILCNSRSRQLYAAFEAIVGAKDLV